MTGMPEPWKKPELPDWSLRQCIDGKVNPVPKGDANRIRCVNSWPFQIYGICFLVLATSPINGGPVGAQLGNLNCIVSEMFLFCARSLMLKKSPFILANTTEQNRNTIFIWKKIGKRMFIDRHAVWDPYSAIAILLNPPNFYSTLPFMHNFMKQLKGKKISRVPTVYA